MCWAINLKFPKLSTPNFFIQYYYISKQKGDENKENDRTKQPESYLVRLAFILVTLA